MVDLMREDLLGVAAAARELPGKPHPTTLWRWYREGLRGHRLETVVIGGRRFTSRQALARFIQATTEARDAAPGAPAIGVTSTRRTVPPDRRLAERAAAAGRRLKLLGPKAG